MFVINSNENQQCRSRLQCTWERNAYWDLWCWLVVPLCEPGSMCVVEITGSRLPVAKSGKHAVSAMMGESMTSNPIVVCMLQN